MTTTLSDAQMLSSQLRTLQGVAANSSRSRGSQFIYTRSNHNSVLGIGAYAAAVGAELVPLTDEQMQEWALGQQQQQQDHANQQVQQNGIWQLPSGLQGAGQPQQAVQQQEQGLTQDQVAVQLEPTYHLIAYPAQDNFAGVMYPLQYINKVCGAA